MDTVKGLATEKPQLSPLYFILARFWVQSLGAQAAAVRSLSAWISLLVFPRVYWLCWELFRSASVGGMAVTIVAVGPFHLLYAQQAIPYMMFAVLVLVSNATLRRAIALQKSPATFKYTSKLSKAVGYIYAIALSLGLYSIAVLKRGEVWGRVLCPMPYALCPMPYALCPMSTSYY